jgi:hypothetical protein
MQRLGSDALPRLAAGGRRSFELRHITHLHPNGYCKLHATRGSNSGVNARGPKSDINGSALGFAEISSGGRMGAALGELVNLSTILLCGHRWTFGR